MSGCRRRSSPSFREDLYAGMLDAFDDAGDLGARARAATRVGPIRATADLPNMFRRPFGPGWALVGDAGLVMDPITGQGIGQAFRDAEMVSAAIHAGISGSTPLEQGLAAYQQRRDADSRAMYEFTVDLASFVPKPGGDVLFPALAASPAQTDRFLGVLTGVEPMSEFLTPRTLLRLVGVRGMARMILAQGSHRTRLRAA